MAMVEIVLVEEAQGGVVSRRMLLRTDGQTGAGPVLAQEAENERDLEVYFEPIEVQKETARTWRDRLSGPLGPKSKVLAVVILMLGLSASAYILMLPSQRGMEMDGDFGDWKDVTLYKDEEYDAAHAGIDIVGYAIKGDDMRLFLFLEVRGVLFDPPSGDWMAIHIFVDSDNARTGYDIMQIGADYLIEVYGKGGHVTSAHYYAFDLESDGTRAAGDDWGNWSHISPVRAGNDARRLEVAMPYHGDANPRVLFRTSDQSGNSDLSWVVPLRLEERRSPLKVTSRPLVAEGNILSAGGLPEARTYDLLSLELKPLMGTCRLDEITVKMCGTASETDVAAVAVVMNGVVVSTAHFTEMTARLEMGDWEVLKEEHLSIRVELAHDARRGSVLSIGVAGVEAGTRAVTYDVRYGAWYLGSAPLGHVIDGLFHEWTGAPRDRSGDAPPNIDITEYKAARADGSTFFYLRVDGEMLAGTWIPEGRPMAVRDIPGPWNPPGRVHRTGEDMIYVFLSVGSPTTGFMPEGFPIVANRMIEVRGRNGIVTDATYYKYSADAPSEWPWVVDWGRVVAASGRSQIEFSIDIDFRDFRAIYRVVTWRNGTGDMTAPLRISASAGIDDPFAIDSDGSAFRSRTGSSWNGLGRAGDGGSLVDLTMGPNGSTAYALLDNGTVLASQGGEDGWRPYGTGDLDPSETTYVGLCAGSNGENTTVYILSGDGSVLLTAGDDDGWTPFTADALPDSRAYVDIAAMSTPDGDPLIAVLRNEGTVHVAQPDGDWRLLGGTAPPPDGTCYVSIASVTEGPDGVAVLRADGGVWVYDSGTDGWRAFDDDLTGSSAHVSIACDDAGAIFVLRNDGRVHWSTGDGWSPYGNGTPVPPAGTDYIAVDLGPQPTDMCMMLSRSGRVLSCGSEGGGWRPFGNGTPYLPSPSPFVDIAFSGDTVFALDGAGKILSSGDGGVTWSHLASDGRDIAAVSLAADGGDSLFVLANDGGVVRVSVTTGEVEGWGDCGNDTSWTSIASDGAYVYALRLDGLSAVTPVDVVNWTSKGDAGSGSAWISIDAAPDGGYVYAMRNDRSMSRVLSGGNADWIPWAPPGNDTCWVSMAVAGGTLFALRADGRVDRADAGPEPVWTESFGTVGGDGLSGIAASTLEGPFVPEPGLLMAPLILLIVPVARRWGLKGLR